MCVNIQSDTQYQLLSPTISLEQIKLQLAQIYEKSGNMAKRIR